jgi:hypothetical protein
MNLEPLFQKFFTSVGRDEIEIYNEFSLQHELGIYLRSAIRESNPRLKIQFERPASFFGLDHTSLEKKEIDITIFESTTGDKHAIELKYPRKGQHPEQMFKACQDICFLEQLRRYGFGTSFFVMVVDDPLFYSGKGVQGIYRHFRRADTINGLIQKPTGNQDYTLEIRGNYTVSWNIVKGTTRYSVIAI